MQESSAGHFSGDIPVYYERGLGPAVFAGYALDIARRAAAHHPVRLLETAAGTGIVTRELRNALPEPVHLTVTDLTEEMLRHARRKFAGDESVTFLTADALNLPFPDQSFDAVVCQFGVMFFGDKPRSYGEVRRVLQPGGHYLFNVWQSHEHNAFSRVAHETAIRLFAGDPPLFFQVPFGYHEIPVIRQSLRNAGFVNVETSLVILETPDCDPAVLARSMVFGTPIVEQIHNRRGADPERLVEALTEAFIGDLGLPARPLQLRALVFDAH